MNNFLKNNWFQISVLFLLLFLIMVVISKKNTNFTQIPISTIPEVQELVKEGVKNNLIKTEENTKPILASDCSKFNTQIQLLTKTKNDVVNQYNSYFTSHTKVTANDISQLQDQAAKDRINNIGNPSFSDNYSYKMANMGNEYSRQKQINIDFNEKITKINNNIDRLTLDNANCL